MSLVSGRLSGESSRGRLNLRLGLGVRGYLAIALLAVSSLWFAVGCTSFGANKSWAVVGEVFTVDKQGNMVIAAGRKVTLAPIERDRVVRANAACGRYSTELSSFTPRPPLTVEKLETLEFMQDYLATQILADVVSEFARSPKGRVEVTDRGGRFEFRDVPSGNYVAVASHQDGDAWYYWVAGVSVPRTPEGKLVLGADAASIGPACGDVLRAVDSLGPFNPLDP